LEKGYPPDAYIKIAGSYQAKTTASEANERECGVPKQDRRQSRQWRWRVCRAANAVQEEE
jgi:hypothetical protein